MKLLTFMQLAETKTELTFGEIQKNLQLGDNEVEGFLIERKGLFINYVTQVGGGGSHLCGTMYGGLSKTGNLV